jgi:hypothetical protein
MLVFFFSDERVATSRTVVAAPAERSNRVRKMESITALLKLYLLLAKHILDLIFIYGILSTLSVVQKFLRNEIFTVDSGDYASVTNPDVTCDKYDHHHSVHQFIYILTTQSSSSSHMFPRKGLLWEQGGFKTNQRQN